MRKREPSKVISRLVTLVAVGVVSGCTSESELRPFTSDGCSLFPDQSQISGDNWCSCCFEHDIAYWRGGTATQREAADRALQTCVTDKTGNAVLGRLMYEGVQAGGSPYFYNWYRWGYGWGFERKYQALTPAETEQSRLLLEDFFADESAAFCTE